LLFALKVNGKGEILNITPRRSFKTNSDEGIFKPANGLSSFSPVSLSQPFA
jgi:hypothetical protein